MTVLAAIQQACTSLGLSVPTMVFASTAREHQELASIANEMAQRIAYDTHEWSRLKVLATLSGDGAATSFNLPSDYRRMLKKAALWPSATPTVPLTHIADTDRWLGDTSFSNGFITNAWTIIGDQIFIRPTVTAGATVQFYYLTSNFARAANGTAKAMFTADDDTFRLDERALKLGLIWQWRASKGLAYDEDMQSFETALGTLIASDKGSNILVEGRARWPWDSRPAYPFTLGPSA